MKQPLRPLSIAFALGATLSVACGAKPRSADQDAKAKPEPEPGSSKAPTDPVPACGQLVFVSSKQRGHDHAGPEGPGPEGPGPEGPGPEGPGPEGPGPEGPAQQLMTIDAEGGAMRPLVPGPADAVDFPALVTPDGAALLLLRSRPGQQGKTLDALLRVSLSEADATPAPLSTRLAPAMIRNPSMGPQGRFVVFESDAQSFRDLYRLELRQTDALPLRLTGNAEGNFEPAVSPDGQRVAFVSSRDGNAELYVMTADGGAPTRLTTSPGDDSAPRWSPDGQHLAFISARSRERGMDVFVIPADGGEARALVGPERTSPVIARELSFSPDGARVAFVEVSPSSGASVAIASFPAGEILARTNPIEGEGAAEIVDEQPVWSPDGRHLALSRGRGPTRSDILRVDADGAHPTNLTGPASDGRGIHWLPRWSALPGAATSSCARR